MKDAVITVEGIRAFRERVVAQHAEELRRIDGFLEVLEQGRDAKDARDERDPRVPAFLQPTRRKAPAGKRTVQGPAAGEVSPLLTSGVTKGKGAPSLREVLREFAARHGRRGFTQAEAVLGAKERGFRDATQVWNGLRNMVYASKELRVEVKGEERRYFPGITSRAPKESKSSKLKVERELTAQERLHRQVKEEIQAKRDKGEIHVPRDADVEEAS